MAFLGVVCVAPSQSGWALGGGFGGPGDSLYPVLKRESATPDQVAALVATLSPGVSHRVSGCTPPPAWGFGSPADETAGHLVRIGAAAVPFVLQRIADKNEAVRTLVIEILARIQDARTLPVLINACHNDSSESVRVSAAEGLSYSSDPRAVVALVPALRQPNLLIQLFAVRALSRHPQETAIDPLVKLMGHAAENLPSIGPSLTRGQIAEQAAVALGAIGPSAFPSIVELIHSPDPAVQRVGEIALSECNDRRALPELWMSCNTGDYMMRLRAAHALGRWLDPHSILVLTKLMRTGVGGVTGVAAQSLARLGGPALDPFFTTAKDPAYSAMLSDSFLVIEDRSAASRLVEMLKSPIQRVRVTALDKLSMWSDPRALPQILAMTRDSSLDGMRLSIGMLGSYDARLHPEIVEPLLAAMTDKNEWVRSQAASSLFGKHDKRIVPAMKLLVKSPVKDVPELAQLVINQYRP